MLKTVMVSIPAFLVIVFSGNELTAQPDTDETLYAKTIKEIRITGVKVTREYIIMRKLTSELGDPLTRENLETDRIDFKQLDLFTGIAIYAVESNGGVAVVKDVKESIPYLPYSAIQINDENGFSAGAGISSPNFPGRDIALSVSFLAGGAVTVSFSSEYPWITGDHFSFKPDLSHLERENKTDDFGEIANEIYAYVGSYLGSRGRIGGSFQFLSIQSDVPDRTLDSHNIDNNVTLGLSLGYDSRDLWSNTSRGWENELAYERIGGLFGGNGDFWRANPDLRRWIYLARLHTLALFSLTTYTSGTVGKDLAVWQDFNIGGANTIRDMTITHRPERINSSTPSSIDSRSSPSDLFRRRSGSNTDGEFNWRCFGMPERTGMNRKNSARTILSADADWESGCCSPQSACYASIWPMVGPILI